MTAGAPGGPPGGEGGGGEKILPGTPRPRTPSLPSTSPRTVAPRDKVRQPVAVVVPPPRGSGEGRRHVAGAEAPGLFFPRRGAPWWGPDSGRRLWRDATAEKGEVSPAGVGQAGESEELSFKFRNG